MPGLGCGTLTALANERVGGPLGDFIVFKVVSSRLALLKRNKVRGEKGFLHSDVAINVYPIIAVDNKESIPPIPPDSIGIPITGLVE